MKKRPKMILAAAGVLASAAFYVLSGNEKTAGESRTEPLSVESSAIPEEEETFSDKQKEEIRTAVKECLREALTEEVSDTVRDVLTERVKEMVEDGTLSEGLLHCAEQEAGLINVNSAGKEELKTLPGIGDVKAESIIRYREENGPYSAVEELLFVDGIPSSLLEKIRAYITV